MMNFHDVAMLTHNGNLITTAEKLLNEYLSTNTDNHVVTLTLIQPDGSKINIQKGFKLRSIEYTIHPEEKTIDISTSLPVLSIPKELPLDEPENT